MEQNLLPIYKLRMMFLEKINPTFFIKNADLIRRTSLAAQDYLLSGAYDEYKFMMGRHFRNLPGYIAVHKKYNLPYNPYVMTPENTTLNPGLVMDLANSLNTDIINLVVNSKGEITDMRNLPKSEVLRVYHNSQNNGTPINVLQYVPMFQIERMMLASRQITR